MWAFVEIKLNLNILKLLLFILQFCPYEATLHSRLVTTKKLLQSEEEFSVRIVGGHTVDISQVPYQAAIETRGLSICGAAIVTSSHVITAGHCVWQTTKTQLSVRVGTSLRAKGGLLVAVANITVHPNFNLTFLRNDIAVLKLATPIPRSPATQHVFLPPPGIYWTPGTEALVTGFGARFAKQLPQQTPLELQAVELEIIDLKFCVDKFSRWKMDVDETQICVGSPSSSWTKDSCGGDSGGPLVVGDFLAGLVSYGLGCATPDYPAVYTNVSAYRHFIDGALQI